MGRILWITSVILCGTLTIHRPTMDVLNTNEAVGITAGETIQDKVCSLQWDCDGFQASGGGVEIVTCPNPVNGYCTTCRGVPPGLIPFPIFLCVNSVGDECNQHDNDVDCGKRWLGRCSGSDCTNLITWDVDCLDYTNPVCSL